ncbi:MAG: hypothetical protein Q8R37_05800 [Nanoarchaeota archaeon]|nr:hypothetical protein [Nanoarchaeota archaeon]
MTMDPNIKQRILYLLFKYEGRTSSTVYYWGKQTFIDDYAISYLPLNTPSLA